MVQKIAVEEICKKNVDELSLFRKTTNRTHLKKRNGRCISMWQVEKKSGVYRLYFRHARLFYSFLAFCAFPLWTVSRS